MEKQITGLIYSVVAIVVVLLVIVLVVKFLYEPSAVDTAIQATQPSSQTVGGHVYNFTGNGLDPTVEGQRVKDQDNRMLSFGAVLGGFAIFLIIIFGIVAFFRQKHY